MGVLYSQGMGIGMGMDMGMGLLVADPFHGKRCAFASD